LQATLERRRFASGALAVVFFALFAWLGSYVTAHGEPPAFWAIAKAVRGEDLALAWAFTNCGWPQVLAPLYLICVAVAVLFVQWRERMSFLVVSGLAGWLAADWFQRYFARPRRGDWLLRHEHAFSYPSSHASTATGFYLLAAFLLLRSELPARIRYPAFAVLIAVWGGILWSRLALAAHYPTDVAGGVCLGLGIIFIALAAIRSAGPVRAGG
jgi:membrane-associated phospholipid phosphatase